MLDVIFNNHLLLASLILLLLLAVPALVVRGHNRRGPLRLDRRQHSRPGIDRRA